MIEHDAIIFRGEEDKLVSICVRCEITRAEPDVGLPRGVEIMSVTDEDGKEIELTEREEDRIIANILEDNPHGTK